MLLGLCMEPRGHGNLDVERDKDVALQLVTRSLRVRNVPIDVREDVLLELFNKVSARGRERMLWNA